MGANTSETRLCLGRGNTGLLDYVWLASRAAAWRRSATHAGSLRPAEHARGWSSSAAECSLPQHTVYRAPALPHLGQRVQAGLVRHGDEGLALGARRRHDALLHAASRRRPGAAAAGRLLLPAERQGTCTGAWMACPRPRVWGEAPPARTARCMDLLQPAGASAMPRVRTSGERCFPRTPGAPRRREQQGAACRTRGCTAPTAGQSRLPGTCWVARKRAAMGRSRLNTALAPAEVFRCSAPHRKAGPAHHR